MLMSFGKGTHSAADGWLAAVNLRTKVTEMSIQQRLVGFAALLLVCALATPVFATVYYVDAAGGDDKASGTTQEQAFKSITRAAQMSKPGDEVIVGPGTYTSVVTIDGFANATERTIFRAEPAGKALLCGEPTETPGERKLEFCRFMVRRPCVTLIGFNISDTSGHAIEFSTTAPKGVVQRCIVRDNKIDGIFFYKHDGGRVENCLLLRNERYGIWFYETTHGTAVNNTCYRNGQAGIAVNGATDVVIFNNILADNGTGLRLSGEGTATVHSDYNLYAGVSYGSRATANELRNSIACTLPDWQELSGQEGHSLKGVPLFRNPEADDFTPGAPPVMNWSPALTAGLRTEMYAGQQAPATDLLGTGKGPGVILAVGALFARNVATGTPFTTLHIVADGRMSVGVFDAKGHILRELLTDCPVRKGTRNLYWDGRDAQGKALLPGQYSWRAVMQNLRGLNEGSVGDSGKPPYCQGNVPTGINSIALDSAGNYFTTTFWDEAGFDVVKYNPEGVMQWVPEYYIRNVAGGFGQAIATDGKYVFVGLARNVKEENSKRFMSDQIRRLDCVTGKPVDFPRTDGTAKSDPREANNIIVNPVKDKPWITHLQLTNEENRRMFGIRGLACDAQRLWVSNYYRAVVESYDKETGKKLAEFPADKPMGIGVAADGKLWVCQGGDQVTEYMPDGNATGRVIDKLSDPIQATFGGPKGHLFIAQLGAGQVREYDVTGAAPALVRQFGHKAGGPGRVLPDVFWDGPQGLAVDAQGRMTLSDPGTGRILRYTTDFKVWQQYTSDFITTPFVDERAPDVLMSGNREYQVNYATGAWDFTYNWAPAQGIRRTLPNGRDYLFELGGHRMGVVVWAIEKTGDKSNVRKCAMLGGRWMGNDDLGEGVNAGKYSWQDTNGDGRVQDNELVWTQPIVANQSFMAALAPGWWVDKDGTLWLCEQVTKSILKFPLLGFDVHGNPRYDWAKAVTVAPADTSPTKFVPNNVKTTPQGDLYVQGTVDGKRDTSYFWMGGTAVARFTPDGTRCWLRVLPYVTVATAVDGAYWYTGEGMTAKETMYTDDGLTLCEMAPGRASGYTSGWIDQALGLYAFQHPRNKQHYIYAEEGLYGKSIRYHILGLDTLRRVEGKVTLGQ